MVQIFNFDKSTVNKLSGDNGKLRDVNGVNGSPRSIAPGFPDLHEQFNQMGIRHIRFHDNLGIGDIDNYLIHNDSGSQLKPTIPTYKPQKDALNLAADLANIRTIFPNAAKGMRQGSYQIASSGANYGMTDAYLKEVMTNHPEVNPANIQREILFRVGRTNRGGYEPPQNFDVYAQLVADVVARYSRDYQEFGLPRKVTHWEIWNEPDLTFFWNSNNPDLFYDFFGKVSKAIKAVDPTAKVGGPGVANGYNPGGQYLDGLLDYCAKNNIEIDFLSWHFYATATGDPLNILDITRQIEQTIKNSAFPDLESLCTEWNLSPYGTLNTLCTAQSPINAAFISSCLMYMQHGKVDRAYYYRGDASSFGLFNDEPGYCTPAAQAFHLYHKLMSETANILVDDQNFDTGLTTMACINDAGDQINVLAANYFVTYDYVNENLDPKPYSYKQHYIDGNRPVDTLLKDSWGFDKWFGNTKPSNNPDSTGNYVIQNTTVKPLDVASVKTHAKSYADSDKGVEIVIHNVDFPVDTYSVYAWRITDKTRLDRMLPTLVDPSEISHSLVNNTLKIRDEKNTRYTVAFYTIVKDKNKQTISL